MLRAYDRRRATVSQAECACQDVSTPCRLFFQKSRKFRQRRGAGFLQACRSSRRSIVCWITAFHLASRVIIRVGQRVRVPLGRGYKLKLGYVVRLTDTSDYPKIKDLHSIDDDRVLLDEKLMELARWMSRYYVTPLGVVIENIIPSAVKKDRPGIFADRAARQTAQRDSGDVREDQSAKTPGDSGAIAAVGRRAAPSSCITWPTNPARPRPRFASSHGSASSPSARKPICRGSPRK